MSDQDDALARALRAYSRSTNRELLDSEGLRRRILDDVAAPARRAPRKLSFVLALAATFVASAALAATQPVVRQAVSRGIQTLFGAPSSPARSGPARRAGNGVAASPASAAPTVAAPPHAPPATSPDELPVLPRSSSAPRHARSTALPSPAAPPLESAKGFDAQVESYRRAHRLHFGGARPAEALAAWDQHLDAYPAGSFGPDARFNRALCLLRLGRRDDARAALRPFAEAGVGSYRQQEAASLLLSLDSTQ
jgi:hypothetical protein